jgi:hypothetical protein
MRGLPHSRRAAGGAPIYYMARNKLCGKGNTIFSNSAKYFFISLQKYFLSGGDYFA